MLDAATVNPILVPLIKEAGKRKRSLPARIDRLQSMVIALGEKIGMDTDTLVRWRVSLVHTECAQILSDAVMAESGIDPAWLVLDEHNHLLFQEASMIAESWNSAWEQGTDPAEVVAHDCSAVVEPELMRAFGHLVDVILPVIRSSQ